MEKKFPHYSYEKRMALMATEKDVDSSSNKDTFSLCKSMKGKPGGSEIADKGWFTARLIFR